MRKSLALAVGWGVAALAFGQTALPQQFIPKPPPPPASVPKPDAQIVPGISPAAPAVDACALSPIKGAELTALRSVIMELLAKDKAAQDDFVKAESAIPGDCTRRRAVFYLQALARIKAG